MPVSTGMLVKTSKIVPKATSMPATHMTLEKIVATVIAALAVRPKRCSMKSATVMTLSRRKTRAKNIATRIRASAPPQGSAITPSMPSSNAAPAPPSIIAPPNQVAMTVIEHIGSDRPRPATMKSATVCAFREA